MNDFTGKHSLIPLRDFFKNPEKISYKISPDGKYLSFLLHIITGSTSLYRIWQVKLRPSE